MKTIQHLIPFTPRDELHPAPVELRYHAFIDFDGTITVRDVIDELIVRHAIDDRWREIELQWQRGEIGSRECLAREFELIRIGQDALSNFLATVPADPGVQELFTLFRAHGVPFAILSDGIDLFIRTILDRIGERDVLVRSNEIRHVDQTLTLHCPHAHADCVSRAAHCKCHSAAELATPGATTIYIGDGRSDLCPARRCDLVFAKGVLARVLSDEGRAFTPFNILSDVARSLSALWAGRSLQA